MQTQKSKMYLSALSKPQQLIFKEQFTFFFFFFSVLAFRKTGGNDICHLLYFPGS